MPINTVGIAGSVDGRLFKKKKNTQILNVITTG